MDHAPTQKRMSFITNIDPIDDVKCAPYIPPLLWEHDEYVWFYWQCLRSGRRKLCFPKTRLNSSSTPDNRFMKRHASAATVLAEKVYRKAHWDSKSLRNFPTFPTATAAPVKTPSIGKRPFTKADRAGAGRTSCRRSPNR